MSQKWQIDRGRCAGLRIYKVKLIIFTTKNSPPRLTESQTFSLFFSFFFKRFSETALLSFFSKCLFVHWCYSFETFFFFFFFAFFFLFAFRRFWPRPRFFGLSRLFSAFLGLLRRPRFWAKWEPFRASSSQFFIRDMVTFSGAQKRMWFPLLEELLTPTLPSNIFKPTFSQCLLLSSLQHFHTGMPAFFSFTCCNTTGLHTFCLLLELARTTSTIHPTNFFRLPPVPFRWAWAPPFLTV